MNPGDVITYMEMCQAEGASLQRGMNFRLHGITSVILMSLREDAAYADRVEDDGRTLIYEGHDAPNRKGGPDPKTIDQPLHTPTGTPTQNGRFWEAATARRDGGHPQEPVRVYEKVRTGLWVFNGVFGLQDAWTEPSGTRLVIKFRLELAEAPSFRNAADAFVLPTNRLIPSKVKQAVWKRDNARCVECGATDNLHFDHVLPFSKGGSSLLAENIQLLCARHNLSKGAKL